MNKYTPISPKIPHFMHGGDYNPDQWIATPEIWDEDMRLMKLANCNTMSIGIFSWTSLEPEEGRFNFEWLDTIMDKLHKNGGFAVLATPSGARPAWMSQKYPEVLRVQDDRTRNLHGTRHNHCFTSPIYRQKVKIINQLLAKRYKDHPAIILWHISNEYSGECHCELCQEAFRNWLKVKYDNDLNKLNQAWWTTFWSHTYTDWSQIESPSKKGEFLVHGHNLDWKRFVTYQTTDFMKHEIDAVKEIASNIPVTTNFMGTFPGIDYWKMAPYLDVISWDSYPCWHSEESLYEMAGSVAFTQDINRSLKHGKPFMLMESTPSVTNWQKVSKQKRPGMHILSSIQAVAHGSDTVQYFQWRKSRGSSEKFHGAVVDHCGHENTRIFKEVSELGNLLKKMDSIIGTVIKPEVAVIYDWENRWAIDDARGPRNEKKDYELTCVSHYKAIWKMGVSADVIDMDCDFSGYKLLIAPMLYMLKPGVAERIEKFVSQGGTFVTTYLSGIVDENDLCFLGGFPGPLRKVTGIWAEEIDGLYDCDVNYVKPLDESLFKMNSQYEARELCDLIHAETAKVLATYRDDFYAGMPALTVNEFGKGKTYYISFRNNKEFLIDFYSNLTNIIGIKPVLDINIPEGISVQQRTDGEYDYIFIMNFSEKEIELNLPAENYKDLLSGNSVYGTIKLDKYDLKIITRTTAKVNQSS